MASEAVRKQRAVRRRMFGRTMLACGALFLAIFVLMTGQLMLGQDPAVGAGRQPATTAQVAQGSGEPGDLKSVAGRAIGSIVGGILVDTLGDDEEGGRQEPARSAPAPSQAPAPVQSGSS